MIKLNKDVLPEAQKKIYPKLSEIKHHGFMLFGGTAIALQLGHRESVDFDFFVADRFDETVKDFLKNLKNGLNATVLQSESNTLTFKTSNGVKISFFGGLDFVKTTTPIKADDDTLKIASLSTLLAAKLKVINDRAEWKDYTDIANILRSGRTTLDIGLNRFGQIWGNEIPKQQILKSLTYFSDGDLYKLSTEDKKTLENCVNNYVRLKTQSESEEYKFKP